MGTHLIPREVDGDARILLVFTPKGFVGTIIGILVGVMLYTFADFFGAKIVGIILLGICALIGFIVGQVKMPDSNALDLFKKTGGEYISEIIKKYFKFRKTRKIYVYDATDYGQNIENKSVEEVYDPLTRM